MKRMSKWIAWAPPLALLFEAQCGGLTGGETSVVAEADAANGCPANAPASGQACSLPDGTSCDRYASPCMCCPRDVFVCRNGKWLVTTVDGPPNAHSMVCPPNDLPIHGTPCGNPCVAVAPPTCEYTCATNGFEAVARCRGSVWDVTRIRVVCDLDAGIGASDGTHDR